MTALRDRRLMRAFAIGVLLTSSITACSGSSGPADPLQRLRFGVLPSVDQLPYFVMREKGFDIANGLSIIETEMQGGIALVEGMTAGTIDMAYAGSIPLFIASRTGDVPRRVIGVAAGAFADTEHPVFAVFAGPDVETWSDLEGQDIGVNQSGTIGDISVRARLRAEGIEGVRLVPIPFPNQGLAVAGGNVAAAVMLEPFITQSLLRGDGHILDWVVGGGQPFPEFAEVVISASTGFLAEHPDTVRGFLRAEMQAVAWIAEHEAEARTILARRLGLIEEVGRTMRLPRWTSDAHNDPVLLEQIRDTMIELEPDPPPAATADIYDETLLNEVLAEE